MSRMGSTDSTIPMDNLLSSNGIEMQLPANAENVSLVRHALAGAAESLGMSEVALADLKTVVTEACMNVAQHAYDEPGGPMEVRAWPDGDEMVVVVADSGHGMRPRAETSNGSLRLGLSLIASMTREFEISGKAGGGTRIKMKIPLRESAAPEITDGESKRPEDGFEADGAGVQIAARDTVALAPILSRVVAVLAARKDLSMDQLSDAVLFSDAIAGDISRVDHRGSVRIVLDEVDGGVELRVGPLRRGDAERLRDGLSLPGELGGSLESLAESIEIESEGEYDQLKVRFGSSAD